MARIRKQDIEKQIPIRKLWELLRTYGATVKDVFNRTEIEESLKEVGYDREYQLEDPSNYWTFKSRNVGTGYVTAEDIDGNYSAFVYPDGSCKLIKHKYPNRHNRIPNVKYQDEIIELNNLEQFASSMVVLLNESDIIFDESAVEFNKEKERIDNLPINQSSSIHGADEKIEQMRVLSEEYGLSGKHSPSINDLPFKLAECMGISLLNEDLSDKNWQELSSEICKDIIDGDMWRGPKNE